MEAARSLTFDEEELRQFAARLPIQEIIEGYRWNQEYQLASGSVQDFIDYVFTVDALNFGSGFSPLWKARRKGTTYTAVAAALTRLRENGTALSAAWAAEVKRSDIAELLDCPDSFPLIGMYAESLQELGSWVVRTYGSYDSLIAALPKNGKAAAIVELLTSNLSCFNDCSVYNGTTVYFYKRAQILVSDLHLALGPASPFTADDISSLTAFADNLVPHVLRREGVLVYDAKLLQRINNRELLEAGSACEIELRAAAVNGVERLVAIINKERQTGAAPAMLDAYLWKRGQLFKDEPRHLTKSFFY